MQNSTIHNRAELLRELSVIKPQLTDKYGITKLGIFGSAARDEMKSESDIDIVLEMKEPDLFTLVHVKEFLESDLQKTVDIVYYRDQMNAYLKKKIQTEALYV